MGYSEKRQVHVTIMGEDTICTLEKAQSSNDKESTGYKVKTRIYVGDSVYENSKEFDSMEFLIIDLQKRLPESVVLACCQTCQHGNFCPFGDNEDEIFCLHGYSPESKGDVVGIISKKHTILPYHELLSWCDKYKVINDSAYTYNDWLYYIDENGNGR